jgi:hypothetical protein
MQRARQHGQIVSLMSTMIRGRCAGRLLRRLSALAARFVGPD